MSAVDASGANWYQRYIKLEWSPEIGLTALASSGYFTIRHTISGDIGIEHPGGLCVNGAALQKLVKPLPKDQLTLCIKDRGVSDEEFEASSASFLPGEKINMPYALTISTNDIEVEIIGAGVDKYPEILSLEPGEDSFEMQIGEIREAVDRVEYAHGVMRGRPGLSCVEAVYDSDREVTEFACSDRHRIAAYTMPGAIEAGGKVLNGLIPVGVFKAAAAVSKDPSDIVKISMGENQVSLFVNDTLITSGIINAPFPEWRKRIRRDEPTVSLVVDRKMMLNRLSVYGAAAKMRRDIIDITVTPCDLRIVADSQLAKAQGTVVGVGGSGSGSVAASMNIQYMQEALSHLQSDQATIRVWADDNGVTSSSPIEFAAAGDDSKVLYVVLPMTNRE
jgi:DNA polymerase III sliding clamp (beta) subunit (PCNA family)